MSRAELARRQADVLGDLLAGRVPAGFDARGSRLTTLVLHRKRSDAALAACPELDALPGWRDCFHAWAADHPQVGCAHDDVDRFADDEAGDDEAASGWVALHRVYSSDRRLARVRVDGRPAVAVRLGGHVLVLSLPGRVRDRGPTRGAV